MREKQRCEREKKVKVRENQINEGEKGERG